MKTTLQVLLCLGVLTAIFARPVAAQIGALGAISAISGESGSADLGPVLVRMAYPMQAGESSISYIYGYTKYTKRDGESTMTSLNPEFDRRMQVEADYYIYTIGLTDGTRRRYSIR